MIIEHSRKAKCLSIFVGDTCWWTPIKPWPNGLSSRCNQCKFAKPELMCGVAKSSQTGGFSSQLVSTGRLNGKKTCIDLRTNLSSTKLDASPRKQMAKRNASWTHVGNLRLLVSPFGKGLKGSTRCGFDTNDFALLFRLLKVAWNQSHATQRDPV